MAWSNLKGTEVSELLAALVLMFMGFVLGALMPEIMRWWGRGR